MLTVTKTQLTFAAVESLQTTFQTNLCGGMDQPWSSDKSTLPHSPITPADILPVPTDETIVQTCQTSNLQSSLSFLEFDRFNSFLKLVRVFCFIFRFWNFIKTKQHPHSILNVAEIHSASIQFLQLIQSGDLKDEIAMLHSPDILHKIILTKLLLFFLDPARELVRFGGRLTQGDFSQLKQNPVLLS